MVMVGPAASDTDKLVMFEVPELVKMTVAGEVPGAPPDSLIATLGRFAASEMEIVEAAFD